MVSAPMELKWSIAKKNCHPAGIWKQVAINKKSGAFLQIENNPVSEAYT